MHPRSPQHSQAVTGSNPRALIVLNAILLGLLAGVTFAPEAEGQFQGRGEYTMVAGSVNASESSAVYIVNSVNQELMVVTYNHNTKQVAGIGYRNLAADGAEVLRARSRPGG